MDLEIFKVKSLTNSGLNNRYDFPLFISDIPYLIEKVRQEDDWKKDPLNSLTILQTQGKRTLLLTLMPETEIKSRQNGKLIRFQIYEGKIDFVTKKEIVTVKKGQRLVFRDKTKYKIIAREETILLLTLVTGQEQPAERLVVYTGS